MESTNIKKVKDKESKEVFLVRPIGSFLGFIYTIILGFAVYFILNSFKNVGQWISYNDVVSNAGNNVFYKLIWSIMNFTEAQFYAGILASIGIILGGFIAWRLDNKKSKLAGFSICYGTNLWPWVFASQVLSLFVAIFVLNFTRYFDIGDYTWLPTFITVVGVPPAVMLLYGPNIRALLTGSILGGILSFPIAFWFMNKIIPIIEAPVVVGNVLTMAITGIIVCQTCKILPWMKKIPFKTINKELPELTEKEKLREMSKPSWFVRRVLADFSEAQFYGNEIAGIVMLIGISLDWILSSNHPGYASGAIPCIILSQFIAASVGVLLYFDKYVKEGWYATYVPVVSVGPACVLTFGATIPVAVIAGVLGGILGGPFAEYLAKKLPEDIHPTVANVTSMAVCTIIVTVVMRVLPWF